MYRRSYLIWSPVIGDAGPELLVLFIVGWTEITEGGDEEWDRKERENIGTTAAAAAAAAPAPAAAEALTACTTVARKPERSQASNRWIIDSHGMIYYGRP